MKKTHIALLILVVAAIATFVSVIADLGSYETFKSASMKPGKPYYVVGYLIKDKEMTYDPKIDPNHFIFYAKDKSGDTNKVIFNGERPRDIEKSEQLVMMGYEDAGTFHCSRIQMKCPSKYKKDMVAQGKGG